MSYLHRQRSMKLRQERAAEAEAEGIPVVDRTATGKAEKNSAAAPRLRVKAKKRAGRKAR